MRHACQSCLDLRAELDDYNRNNAERWHCGLPDAVRGEGYQLRFVKAPQHSPATNLFWEAHRSSGREITAVCDPLLFFHDFPNGKLFRFVDTNIEEPSRSKALAELKSLHHDDFSNELHPGHFYVELGAILAAKSIREYFWREGRLRVPMVLSKEMTRRQLLDSSRVLIGTVRTNNFMRQIFSSPADTGMVAYRLDPDHFAWVTIDTRKVSGVESLEKLGMTTDATGKGVLITPSEGMTLGIVTRIVNPDGHGAITFISSDASLNLKQMAQALTDEKQLQRIFMQMGRSLDDPLPASLEMLFLVRLAPGNLDDEAGQAQLLSWRM